MDNRHLKILVLTAAFLCLSVVPPLMAAEPSYNGKPLSEWLLILKIGYNSAGGQMEASAAREAIRHMGTNAIPTLLDILSATDRNKWWVLRRLESRGFREVFKNKNVSAGDLQNMGVQGFGILGTNAVSAIPKLDKMFRRSEACSAAAEALAELGPAGFAALTNGMSDEKLAGVVVWTIGHKGGGDEPTLTRILISALNNPERATRGNAAGFLGSKDAALAIPALIPMLDDKEYYPRERAAHALSSYGPAAKDAVPKLLLLYTNSWDLVYMWALKAIDINTAAEAEQLLVNSGPLSKARGGYTRTKLTNGLELIAGGSIHTEIPKVKNHYLSSAQLYDPKTGKWTETGEMTTIRYYHMAVLLPNGKVLVAGGKSPNRAGRLYDLSSAELYDPATGQWTATGSMHDSHESERIALQLDGKVLVYRGGFDQYPIRGHELYDPATGTWAVVPKEQESSRAWRPAANQR
jgi:hypothetical protein